MNQQNHIKEVSEELEQYGFPISQTDYSYNDLQQALAYHINQLITEDLATFVQLLYRLDVSEQQVRNSLSNTTTNLAANTIAELIIERQLKKIEMRKLFKKDDNIRDDEKW